jgi:hypothetical protein
MPSAEGMVHTWYILSCFVVGPFLDGRQDILSAHRPVKICQDIEQLKANRNWNKAEGRSLNSQA